jgi:hypothetical protein
MSEIHHTTKEPTLHLRWLDRSVNIDYSGEFKIIGREKVLQQSVRVTTYYEDDSIEIKNVWEDVPFFKE